MLVYSARSRMRVLKIYQQISEYLYIMKARVWKSKPNFISKTLGLGITTINIFQDFCVSLLIEELYVKNKNFIRMFGKFPVSVHTLFAEIKYNVHFGINTRENQQNVI